MLIKHFGVANDNGYRGLQHPSCSGILPAVTTSRMKSKHARKVLIMNSGTGGGLSYKDAGVDIDAGNELVRRIKAMNPSIGGFSGMVPFGR